MIYSLSVRQHGAHRAHIGRIDLLGAPQLTLPLGGLLGQDVAQKCAGALYAAAPLNRKTLGSAFLGLHLGHVNASIFDIAPGGPLRERFQTSAQLVCGFDPAMLQAGALA